MKTIDFELLCHTAETNLSFQWLVIIKAHVFHKTWVTLAYKPSQS